MKKKLLSCVALLALAGAVVAPSHPASSKEGAQKSPLTLDDVSKGRESMKKVRALASKGEPDAVLVMAEASFLGAGVPKDAAESRRWLDKLKGDLPSELRARALYLDVELWRSAQGAPTAPEAFRPRDDAAFPPPSPAEVMLALGDSAVAPVDLRVGSSKAQAPLRSLFEYLSSEHPYLLQGAGAEIVPMSRPGEPDRFDLVLTKLRNDRVASVLCGVLGMPSCEAMGADGAIKDMRAPVGAPGTLAARRAAEMERAAALAADAKSAAAQAAAEAQARVAAAERDAAVSRARSDADKARAEAEAAKAESEKAKALAEAESEKAKALAEAASASESQQELRRAAADAAAARTAASEEASIQAAARAKAESVASAQSQARIDAEAAAYLARQEADRLRAESAASADSDAKAKAALAAAEQDRAAARQDAAAALAHAAESDSRAQASEAKAAEAEARAKAAEAKTAELEARSKTDAARVAELDARSALLDRKAASLEARAAAISDAGKPAASAQADERLVREAEAARKTAESEVQARVRAEAAAAEALRSADAARKEALSQPPVVLAGPSAAPSAAADPSVLRVRPVGAAPSKWALAPGSLVVRPDASLSSPLPGARSSAGYVRYIDRPVEIKTADPASSPARADFSGSGSGEETVGSGTTLGQAMARLGHSWDVSSRVAQAMSPYMSARAIPAGQKVIVSVGSGGAMTVLLPRPGRATIQVSTEDGRSWSASEVSEGVKSEAAAKPAPEAPGANREASRPVREAAAILRPDAQEPVLPARAVPASGAAAPEAVPIDPQAAVESRWAMPPRGLSVQAAQADLPEAAPLRGPEDLLAQALPIQRMEVLPLPRSLPAAQPEVQPPSRPSVAVEPLPAPPREAAAQVPSQEPSVQPPLQAAAASPAPTASDPDALVVRPLSKAQASAAVPAPVQALPAIPPGPSSSSASWSSRRTAAAEALRRAAEEERRLEAEERRIASAAKAAREAARFAALEEAKQAAADEEADRQARAEARRMERAAKLEAEKAERQAKIERERLEREAVAAAERRAEEDRLARVQALKMEKEAKAEAQRMERQAKAEAQRQERESAAIAERRAEEDRLARVQAAKAEQEAKASAERLEREARQAVEREDRLAREAAVKAAHDGRVAAARKAIQEERLAKESAEIAAAQERSAARQAAKEAKEAAVREERIAQAARAEAAKSAPANPFVASREVGHDAERARSAPSASSPYVRFKETPQPVVEPDARTSDVEPRGQQERLSAAEPAGRPSGSKPETLSRASAAEVPSAPRKESDKGPAGPAAIPNHVPAELPAPVIYRSPTPVPLFIEFGVVDGPENAWLELNRLRLTLPGQSAADLRLFAEPTGSGRMFRIAAAGALDAQQLEYACVAFQQANEKCQVMQRRYW